MHHKLEQTWSNVELLQAFNYHASKKNHKWTKSHDFHVKNFVRVHQMQNIIASTIQELQQAYNKDMKEKTTSSVVAYKFSMWKSN